MVCFGYDLEGILAYNCIVVVEHRFKQVFFGSYAVVPRQMVGNNIGLVIAIGYEK